MFLYKLENGMGQGKTELTCKGSSIFFAPAFPSLKEFIEKHSYSRYFVISDRAVFSLYGTQLLDQFDALALAGDSFFFESGEEAKGLSTLEKCWNAMHRSQLDRASLVVALGGGVATDLAGFAASCYMRGVALMHLPTTLLGMVDASIGGKTGINLPTGKNVIGTFYQPVAVFIDSSFLATLPKREVVSGMAEVIKCAVIRDPSLFHFLETHMEKVLSLELDALQHILFASCKIKAETVDQDEKEHGLRALLNYGHTFGHALEAATHYRAYAHGEAVSIGMCCAADLSLHLGLTDTAFVKRQEALCERAGLPVRLKKRDEKQLLQLMQGDKKTAFGSLALILPRGIGRADIVRNLDPILIETVWKGRMD
jgi:3-dehydroquinate synthase